MVYNGEKATEGTLDYKAVACDSDEDLMLESVMSEDATREAPRTAKDTPVVEAGIKVEFLEEEGVVESDVALDFK
nr:hypothetical protein [Tanacetum cinerariifolium]